MINCVSISWFFHRLKLSGDAFFHVVPESSYPSWLYHQLIFHVAKPVAREEPQKKLEEVSCSSKRLYDIPVIKNKQVSGFHKSNQKQNCNFLCFYLFHKVASFTVQEHIDAPINFLFYLVSCNCKAQLISGSKPIYLVEPNTCEKVCDRYVFSYDGTTFRNICQTIQKVSIVLTRQTKIGEFYHPHMVKTITTCYWKLSLGIRC